MKQEEALLVQNENVKDQRILDKHGGYLMAFM